jgi:hypothetical protein
MLLVRPSTGPRCSSVSTTSMRSTAHVGGRLRFIALILEGEIAQGILQSLGLPFEA